MDMTDETDLIAEYLGSGGISSKLSKSSRFIPRSVDRVPYIPPGGSGFPKNAGDIVFEDMAGHSLCWRMGQQTAAEFVKGRNGFPLKGANDQLFHTGRIKVFFPIVDGNYYASKSLTIKVNPTLARVLDTVQICAYHSVADHLVKNKSMLKGEKVTFGEVLEALNRTVSCHLVCSRAGGWNHVYVRVS